MFPGRRVLETSLVHVSAYCLLVLPTAAERFRQHYSGSSHFFMCPSFYFVSCNTVALPTATADAHPAEHSNKKHYDTAALRDSPFLLIFFCGAVRCEVLRLGSFVVPQKEAAIPLGKEETLFLFWCVDDSSSSSSSRAVLGGTGVLMLVACVSLSFCFLF